MGRKPDLEKKQQIEKTARKLFVKKGFAGTSYQQIADAMGTEKSNIQRHFPKKDIFVDHFFQDLLDAAAKYCGPGEENYFRSLYQIGVIYFAFLLSPPMRQFTTDVLSERALTEVIIQKDMQWAAEYLSGFNLEEQPGFRDDVALVMGGVYELVYQHLAGGVDTDPRDLMSRAIELFAFTLHQPFPAMPVDSVPDSFVNGAVEFLLEQLK